MRKITKKESKKDVKKKQFLLGGIIILLLVLSTFGIVLQNAGSNASSPNNGQDGERITYNGFDFVYNQGLWLSQVGSSVWVFSYNPEDVDTYEGEFNKLGNYYSKDLYYYSEDGFAAQVIQNNFGLVATNIQEGCIEDVSCPEDSVKVNCDQNFVNVEISSDFEDINQENNCVFIRGTQERIPLLLDQFFLKISGIQ